MLQKIQTSNFGINVAGHASGEFGIGEGMRGTLRGLQAVGIPFTIRDIKVDWHRNLDSTYTNFSDEQPYAINLVHTPPIGGVMESLGSEYFQGRYNIGYWAWELPLFPPGWLYAFYSFDEIWTPSNYSAEAISAVSPIPVVKVPHSIYLPETSLSREALGLPKDKFIFLFLFDYHSRLSRKNPLGTIEAFKRAFGKSNNDVLLLIKSSNGKFHPELQEQLLSHTDGWSSIKFIEGHLQKEELHALIDNCNCYVSLHRAEGFGLTMAEAMFYGKPVIATAHSANMEFMNVGNSFLVKYDMVTIIEDDGPYFKGNVWAEPDLDHAASLMQYVFENYQEAEQVGARAASEIRSLLSPQTVGSKIKIRLEDIMSRINHPTRSTRLRKIQTETGLYQSQVQVWRQTALQIQTELERCQRLPSIK
ncbi:glycosyltransferase [Microcoleus sp. AR_TQ3_B6]|uniref:glycosyltransferase n=1 Tax=Microcoleus sp. AR_TQ3_B6 TaxID=3055284 RepID=UPI002FCFEA3E